ncbi:hypothetical protein ADL05_26890, partial [Nocardiopsis sp. NRRL B-16309]
MPAPHDVPAEAMDIMALNYVDYRWDLTLTGLRSATVYVLDAAARALDTTRAAAHAELWPLALRLVQEWPVPTTDDHHWRAAFVGRLRQQTWEDCGRVRRLLSRISEPLIGKDDPRQKLVLLLAGAAAWLPLIGKTGGQPHDALAREDLPLGLLVLDALAQRGLTNTYIDNDGARGPENIVVVPPGPFDTLLYIGTEEENISPPPGVAPNILVECSGPEGSSTLYESAHAPVTPALIAEVADLAAEAARGPEPHSVARRFALLLHHLCSALPTSDQVGADERTTPVTLEVDGKDHTVMVPEQHLTWLMEAIQGD